MVAELLLATAAAVLLAPVPYFAVRRSRVEVPLLHVTTAERVSSITAGVPEGWVHLQPGRRWSHRMPLVGWPPHPFEERIYCYRGQEWPGRFRLRFNLPDPEECTHGVVVTVADLAASGGPGCLYRRRIDGSVAWSGEYRGPGRIIERAGISGQDLGQLHERRRPSRSDRQSDDKKDRTGPLMAPCSDAGEASLTGDHE